jgi:hypothetical protein
MNRRLPMAGLTLMLVLASAARAGPPAMAETEINHLLEFVGSSGCEFYRNGSWYDSKRAEAHLRSKYQWLAARAQINTAEDFIEKAATTSSLSGQPYEVRCGGSEAMTSNRWLHDELTRYRTLGFHQKEGGPPHLGGGAPLQ